VSTWAMTGHAISATGQQQIAAAVEGHGSNSAFMGLAVPTGPCCAGPRRGAGLGHDPPAIPPRPKAPSNA
jgi:hypothetical protein